MGIEATRSKRTKYLLPSAELSLVRSIINYCRHSACSSVSSLKPCFPRSSRRESKMCVYDVYGPWWVSMILFRTLGLSFLALLTPAKIGLSAHALLSYLETTALALMDDASPFWLNVLPFRHGSLLSWLLPPAFISMFVQYRQKVNLYYPEKALDTLADKRVC